jgi:biopolymer transport protein TolR
MSMATGNRDGQKAEINMTPMIDVLLVLIIIFMVITPLAPRGLETLVPQQAAGPAPPAPVISRDIIVSVHADESLEINHQPVASEALAERLSALYRTGVNHNLFVRGARDLEYRRVVRVIDIARGAGWDRIGLMTQ